MSKPSSLKRTSSQMLEFEEQDNSEAGSADETSDQESVRASVPSNDPLSAMNAAVMAISTPSSEKPVSEKPVSEKPVSSEKPKRKHQRTGNPKGKFSKLRLQVEYLVAVVRSQQMYGQSEEQIKANAAKVLAKRSESDLTLLLTEIGKLNTINTDVSHTEAINIITDANGEEKEYFQSLSDMTAIQIEAEIIENEDKIEELTRANVVLQYNLETKNTNKSARTCLKRFILDAIAAHDD